MFANHCDIMSDDLYFKGMFDNKLKENKQKNKKLICSKCSSKNIVRITAIEPVFVDVAIIYKCRDCGHQGEAKVIKSGIE